MILLELNKILIGSCTPQQRVSEMAMLYCQIAKHKLQDGAPGDVGDAAKGLGNVVSGLLQIVEQVDTPSESMHIPLMELLAELEDLIDQVSPVGYTFGPHPGSSSDYGFWPHKKWATAEYGPCLQAQSVAGPKPRFVCEGQLLGGMTALFEKAVSIGKQYVCVEEGNGSHSLFLLDHERGTLSLLWGEVF